MVVVGWGWGGGVGGGKKGEKSVEEMKASIIEEVVWSSEDQRFR